MNGHDQRPDPACPRLVAHDSPYTPVRVVELDLDDPGEPRSPGRPRSGDDPDGRVLALVRLHGHPIGLVTAVAPGDAAGLRRTLAETARRDLSGPLARHRAEDALDAAALDAAARPTLPGVRPCRARRALILADPPPVSVVIATHNRPGLLRNCLDSVLDTGYPRLQVLVVDNAPEDDDARTLVQERYPGRVRYLREPVAGLARAHNRALAEVHGRITAFTDDDTVVDHDWPYALAEAFAVDPRVGCVTGLILPAELETRTQAELQQHGGYDKGFTARDWSLAEPPADPLFPFTAGRFGSGANMAFRTALLRRMRGFDPATGTGTPARGGDDLLGFLRVLTAGSVLAYRPDALVWHRDSRAPQALPAQAYGYGVGFGAFLAAAVAREPELLPALARRLPGGIHYAAARRRPGTTGGGRGPRWSRRLALLELEGLLYGPLGYLRSRRQERRRRGPEPSAP
jgi:O-antigen biosynthesis protein